MGFTLLYLGFCCFLVPIPRNIQPKNEGDLSLNSLVGEKKMVFCSFPGFTDKSGDTAQPRILAAIVLCMFYSFTYTLICLGKKQISDMTSVCFFFFFFPGDLTVHFFLGRARVSFKSFSPGFLRNLSVWHVCHYSQSSSESWQFSHNGICWQVVRADSEYVWKTVKLVKKN